MKWIYTFLIIVSICSCLAHKKAVEILPSSHVEDTPLILSETDSENVLDKDDNTSQYTFRYSNGTYWDMNDLTYFLNDTSIKSLDLFNGTFHNLNPLAELKELEELSIKGNDYITDISPIGSLINLKKLSLSNNCREESIVPISALTNLLHLELFYNDRYFKELVPLQQLEYLMLRGYEKLDASYIGQLYSLKELYIDCGPIINIELLKNLTNLEKFYIDSDGLDISWITHLQKLRELELRVNRINDISPLLELPNLVDVSLHKTVVRDIRPLSESKSIKRITGFVLEDNTMNIDIFLFIERGIEFTPYFSDR
jgi:Leucine-rich repeat (LRR) protein